MDEGVFHTQAEAILFGFPPSPVAVTVRPRSRGWRIGGAARSLGIAAVVAPVVAVIPPHAPWVIGAVLGGVVLAKRRYDEEFTVVTVTGGCPKCANPIAVKATRLRSPHPLPCEGCHHDSTLRISDEALAAHRLS